jgi:uncharacterized protein Yka (UPF0111/DUF47 family)
MTKKTRIVAALGELSLCLPSLLNEALAGNDRAKYRLALLQSAVSHAGLPDAPFSNLHAERLSCGVAEAWYDELVSETTRQGADSFSIPHLREVCAAFQDDLAAMIVPLKTARLPQAPAFQSRLDALTKTPWYAEDESITGGTITRLASADASRGDSVHQLIMDLHKALNALQAGIATESVGGAAAYGLTAAERPLVTAFMKGVDSTRALKFDHPGLASTATRAGSKLVIQNDIGATDAHVLVVHVEALTATITYTDNHLPRLLFFQELFTEWAVAWQEVHSRTDRSFEGGVYHLCVGIFTARDKKELKAFLSHLGSRLVFLIDWNRARKRLQLLVSKQEALALLSWAAANDLGHLAFLKAGGERLVFDALQFVAGGTLPFGVSIEEILGRDTAVNYLKFILRTCSRGMLDQRPFALIRDEARVELYEYYHHAQQSLLDLVSNHASLSVEIATAIRDGLLLAAGPESLAGFERIGQRAKAWERKADELVIRARELARQSERAEAIRELLEAADDIPDALEEAAFHLALLSGDRLAQELRLPLTALAQQVVEGTQEFLKAIENVRGIQRSGSPDDMRDFLTAIHRIVAIEEQSDTTERLVRKALYETELDYRLAFVIAECAKKLEAAADALMHAGMTLRVQILGKVTENR